jgi:hypothetical protein
MASQPLPFVLVTSTALFVLSSGSIPSGTVASPAAPGHVVTGGATATWTNISSNATGSFPTSSLIAFDYHDNYTVADGEIYRSGQWTTDPAPNAPADEAAMDVERPTTRVPTRCPLDGTVLVRIPGRCAWVTDRSPEHEVPVDGP